ncbi:hypothetical protein F0L74_29095 [Chitinophaga agrisoli]|uniref:Uncharacterized protein n=1 Tax=Chitinophaga agrisoli TaxID=2607653 RepID=A0A5B2VN79_9BACT|nr:hypothetical protein [Chitinophaga agrisoli]KAA2240224.1 hypothetical protein F0L74_29095 [Chitinophaga agrisoli]
MNDRFFFKLFLVFSILNGTFVLLKPRLLDAGMHFNVLLIGNLLLAGITGLSYFMSRKGLAAANNHVFVRSVYGSTFSKLMCCMVGILVYVLINRPNVSRATIFTLMFLYLVYTVFETLSLYRLLKKKT